MRRAILKIEGQVNPPPKYYRFWDPGTSEPRRRLLCFRWRPGKYQEQITEHEYLGANPGALPNAEVEALAGQVAT